MSEARILALESINVSYPGLYGEKTWQPVFVRLRREDPVHFCAQRPVGACSSITRCQDIKTVHTSHEIYSSDVGGITIAEPEFEPDALHLDSAEQLTIDRPSTRQHVSFG